MIIGSITEAKVNGRAILSRPDVDAYYINIKIVFASRGARKEGEIAGPFQGRTLSIPSLWDTHNTRRFSAICGMVWP